MRRILIVLALLILGLVPAATAGSAAPRWATSSSSRDGVSTSAVAADQAQELGLDVGFVYRNALHGYSALVPAGSLDDLKADPRVAYVERDSIVHVQHDPDRRDVGDRPDRPARVAAQRHVYLHGDRRRGHGLRDRHRHPQDAQRVRRPRRPRDGHDDAGPRHLRRLPRPRHARRRHDRRLDLWRREGRPPRRRARARPAPAPGSTPA